MTKPKYNYVCDECGSTNILRDAWAEWNVEKQDWVLSEYFDNTECGDCGGPCYAVAIELKGQLNDE